MSTARFNTLQNAAGSKSVPVETVVDGSAKAWVNFNGTGTVAIRAAFNVSSITDNGVGDYTVNFTTAMSAANFAPVCFSDGNSGVSISQPSVLATGSVRIRTMNATLSQHDATTVGVAIFR